MCFLLRIFLVPQLNKAKNPSISERELVVEVFKRFYQDEFSAEKLEEICAAIRKRKPVLTL
ncbi:MAG: hypothetical protein RI894_85 [Bacteroidota bacterium]